jgi:hypothetical protein
MTGQEIAKRIQENNKKIEELMDYTTFVLNKEIVQLQAENEALQTLCKHEYEDHICKFCGHEEEKDQ